MPGPVPQPYAPFLDDAEPPIEVEPEPEPTAQETAATAEVATRKKVATLPSDSEFVYSKRLTCPKCSAPGVRLRRLRRADLKKDCWLHVRTEAEQPCVLKIAHYTIKDDPGYQEVE